MSKIVARAGHDNDGDAVSVKTGLACGDLSLAVQSQADESNINTIVRRFGLTGEVPVGFRTPQYGDFAGINDYQSALHVVMQAQKDFLELPADLRSRFDNDPQMFMDFCLDEANRAEMIKLKLIQEPPAPSPTPQA